jgi:methanogenic corrinoid protein MtbC1
MVRRNWFDVVGFSIGSEKLLDGLITLIRLVRRASRNRGLGVMIGGPLVQLRPELVALVGADASADDAPAALTVARGLAMMRVSA